MLETEKNFKMPIEECGFNNNPVFDKLFYVLKFALSITFFLLIFLKYPIILCAFYPSGEYATNFYISSLSQISAFATAMIFFNYRAFNIRNKFSTTFSIALITITILSIIHCIKISNSTYREFFFDLSWISIPLCVMLYRSYIKRLFLHFITALWLLNAVQSIYQLSTHKDCIGITGNRNWNAALLISITPLFLYSIFYFIKKSSNFKKIRPFFLVFSSIITVFTLFLLYKAESRGANIALLFSAILFPFMQGFTSNSDKLKQVTKKVFLFLTFLILSSFFILPLFFGNYISSIISKDVRIPLWHGAYNLFISQPLIGTGSFAFEKFYGYHLPLELFLRPHYFAARFMHPHNQIAYLADSFGVFGLLAFLILLFLPIIACIKNYKKLSVFTKIVFFSYLMLLIHSQLDKIAVQWPTLFILLILQGMLWKNTFTKKFINDATVCLDGLQKNKLNIKSITPHSSKIEQIIYPLLTVVAVTLSGVILYENIVSSYYSRIADIFRDEKDYKKSLEYKQLAINIANSDDDLYDAGMIELLAFRNYPKAYEYFKRLEMHPAGKIVHRNARMAQCLIFMNKKKEALKYLMLEAKAYPLSSLTLYNQMLLEKELGLLKATNYTARQLNSQLKFKGLKPSDMKLILKYPELDNKFNLIPKYRKLNK